MLSLSKLNKGIPHTDFTFSLWSSQPALLVSLFTVMLQDALCCNLTAITVYQTDQYQEYLQ